MTETIKKSIDNGKFGCEIFLDLTKTFDTGYIIVLMAFHLSGLSPIYRIGNNIFLLMDVLLRNLHWHTVYLKAQCLVHYYF